MQEATEAGACMHVGSKCGLANGLAAPGLSGTDGDRWGQMGIDMRLALCLCVWGGAVNWRRRSLYSNTRIGIYSVAHWEPGEGKKSLKNKNGSE